MDCEVYSQLMPKSSGLAHFHIITKCRKALLWIFSHHFVCIFFYMSTLCQSFLRDLPKVQNKIGFVQTRVPCPLRRNVHKASLDSMGNKSDLPKILSQFVHSILTCYFRSLFIQMYSRFYFTVEHTLFSGCPLSLSWLCFLSLRHINGFLMCLSEIMRYFGSLSA